MREINFIDSFAEDILKGNAPISAQPPFMQLLTSLVLTPEKEDLILTMAMLMLTLMKDREGGGDP